jgi:hypothetical protein
MKPSPAFSLSVLFFLSSVLAQHEDHGGGHVMPDGTVMSNQAMAGMDHEGILGEPLGSGTAWLPAGSPVHAHAVHFTLGDWMVMTHGEAVLRYTGSNLNNRDRWNPGPEGTAGQSDYPELERGGHRFDAPNWAMLSAERPGVGDGRLMLRAMLSLDPLTIGRQGYPLLLQTGEGLVDRQHPHDLFMELALLYAHPVNEHNKVFVYLGLPGEPALGPTAFMHRPSIGGNPDAPLAHHFQDATHITHGVATLGYVHRRFKAEVSAFRGREPDSERWNIDAGPLDSWSVRLTQNLRFWSLQGSVANIHDPEPGEHGDVFRTSVSLSRHRTVRPASPVTWASSYVYGMNAGHHGTVAHSFLKESSLTGKRGALWSRWEVLQRGGEELDLPGADAEGQYWVSAITLGAGRTVFKTARMDFFLGGQASVNFYDSALESYYGTIPLSAQVFLKVRPGE